MFMYPEEDPNIDFGGSDKAILDVCQSKFLGKNGKGSAYIQINVTLW